MLQKAHGYISYTEHVSNEEVRQKISQAIGPHDDLLTTVIKRKLRRYGHITRSSGLAKTILQGTVRGGRRGGRQKKRWEDNTGEWTRLKIGEAMRAAEDRERWSTDHLWYLNEGWSTDHLWYLNDRPGLRDR